MTELVTAVFEASSEAEAAARDLEVARIPSAVIERRINADRDGDAGSWQAIAGAWDSKRCGDRPLVTVAVDEIHATVVAGILKKHGPLEVEMRILLSHRR
jgi:hypothetical protein